MRDVIKISEKEKIKITEMCVPTNGELCSSDTACSGDIVILPNLTIISVSMTMKYYVLRKKKS